MGKKRVFLIVLDSVGAGELPDASFYGDEGSHTLKSCYENESFNMPTLVDIGLYNIDNISLGTPLKNTKGAFGKMKEASPGKDTTTGHWEIAGIHLEKAFPTFPHGFPDEIIKEFEKRTGRKAIVNKPYSGTKVLEDFGEQHMKTGALIVYTSADSVFQIAAHEDIVPVEKLYEYCKIAREILVGDYEVGRVIARPFAGEAGNFKRTERRHDFSVKPQKPTMLTLLEQNNFATIGIGKIYDIFAGVGISETTSTVSNSNGMEVLEKYIEKDFEGLCFLNLVDFDMVYGHRNDVDGYAKALSQFDKEFNKLTKKFKDDDIVIITADHGCDPKTPSTDHSREYVPLLVYGKNIKPNVNLKIRSSYSDVGKTIADYFGLKDNANFFGESFLSDIIK